VSERVFPTSSSSTDGSVGEGGSDFSKLVRCGCREAIIGGA